MTFEYQPLGLVGRIKIPIPSQKISKKRWKNILPSLVVSLLEQKLLGTDRNTEVEEIVYKTSKETRFRENNTLTVKHYKPKYPTESAVIVLPQRGSGYDFAQLISLYLASNRINAYELGIPLRDSRLPKGITSITQLPLDLDDLNTIVDQAVCEARGLIDLLPYTKIGICGVSLGAIYSSIVYGIDDRVTSACLILGGGDLAGMILESEDRFARTFRSYVVKNAISKEDLRKKLANIEPCNHTSPGKAKNLLMINAKFDKEVPERYGLLLKEAWGDPELYMVKAGHLSAIKEIRVLLPMVLNHYKKSYR
jgi:hypothetical protein